MISRCLSLAACAVAFIAITQPATASAKRNPYTAEQVCGAGFHKIDKHKLYSGSRFIGKPTYTTVSLKVKGKRRPWVVDYGNFKYYAGPVYKTAPGRCVRWAATVSTPYGDDSFTSPFGHCG